MFLSTERKMQCSIGVWKDEGGSPEQGEDWEAGTDQSCVCPHPKWGYQLRVFKAKGNTRSFLPQNVFLSGPCRSGLRNACSVQTLCTCAVDKHSGWAVVIVQEKINRSVCAQQGWRSPDMSHLLCIHDRAALCMHMHRLLDVQIWSMIGATVTALTRLLHVQKSRSTYRKEDVFGEAEIQVAFIQKSPSPSATCCLFLPSWSKLFPVKSWVDLYRTPLICEF